MGSRLLERVFDDLDALRHTDGLQVEDLQLGGAFNVVRLSDGCFGSSLNFPIQNGEGGFDFTEAREELLSKVGSDPLLRTLARSPSPIDAGIATAVATALSQPLLKKPPVSGLTVERVSSWLAHLSALVDPLDRVCQVGFGGSVDIFARPGVVSHFVVCDLAFVDPSEIERARQLLRRCGLTSEGITFACSPVDKSVLEEVDVLCITGSTLCNGTLEAILEELGKPRIVALQGPSASLYAPSLFRAGITCIYAPLKRSDEWRLAVARDPRLNEFVDGDYVAISAPA